MDVNKMMDGSAAFDQGPMRRCSGTHVKNPNRFPSGTRSQGSVFKNDDTFNGGIFFFWSSELLLLPLLCSVFIPFFDEGCEAFSVVAVAFISGRE